MAGPFHFRPQSKSRRADTRRRAGCRPRRPVATFAAEGGRQLQGGDAIVEIGPAAVQPDRDSLQSAWKSSTSFHAVRQGRLVDVVAAVVNGGEHRLAVTLDGRWLPEPGRASVFVSVCHYSRLGFPLRWEKKPGAGHTPGTTPGHTMGTHLNISILAGFGRISRSRLGSVGAGTTEPPRAATVSAVSHCPPPRPGSRTTNRPLPDSEPSPRC